MTLPRVALAFTAMLTAISCGPTTTTETPPTPSAQPTSQASGKPTAKPASKPSLSPEAVASNVGVPLPGEDVCEKNEDGSLKNPIEPGRYSGLLRSAKCEQQKFLVMARVAGSLGVECNHCHVPTPNGEQKFAYTEETENKQKARWMEATFIRGLKNKQGKLMRCSNCHKNEAGKAAAKVLKAPRDRAFAQVWMHEVMTVKFAQANDQRLRCATCHVGMAPDVDGWIKDVIRHVQLTPEGLARK